MNWNFILGIVCISAWFTHIFNCFASASYGLLIAGAIFFPIGILHGIYV